MFRAGGEDGLIDAAGRVRSREELHLLMASLADRMRNEEVPADNPTIPSGYTYLLQFISHDIADSIVSFEISGDALTPGAHNARARRLILDSLYGDGPEECPQAYQFLEDNALIPRTLLRIGPPRADPLPDAFCPNRDIARCKLSSEDQGLKAKLREGLIADPRNDSHALISQLTVLFHLFHNEIANIVKRQVPASQPQMLPKREAAFRRFLCARLAVTLIYRNIIKKDVLSKILHPAIYERYDTEPDLQVDKFSGVPLEFSFGAFRFGHALVRDKYNVNSAFQEMDTIGALRLSSEDITRKWLVDWARFFTIDGVDAKNLSKMIGPSHSKFIKGDEEFDPKVTGYDVEGLPYRDLLSASFAGLLSVRALCDKLREEGFTQVDEFESWHEPMRNWLIQKSPFTRIEYQAKLDLILKDPPLEFFVLFEARQYGGCHLGPVGSIIVAESIFGALKENHYGLEGSGSELKDRLRTAGDRIFDPQTGVGAALHDEAGGIDSMPALLKFLKQKTDFATG